MLQRWFPGVYVIVLAAMLCITLMLGGCEVFDDIAGLFSTDAQAQQERRIETFLISADSFLILTDSAPNVSVSDGTTTYTQIDGSITFISAGTQQTFTLRDGDTVIERPAAGIVTLIRDN